MKLKKVKIKQIKNKINLNNGNYSFFVDLLLKFFIVFFKRNYSNFITKGAFSRNIKFKNKIKKIKNFIDYYFLNVKSNLRLRHCFKGLKSIKQKLLCYSGYRNTKKKIKYHFFKKNLIKAMFYSIFFKKALPFKFDELKFFPFLRSLHKKIVKKVYNSMYNVNNLFVYIYEIFLFLFTFNKWRNLLLNLVSNLKLKIYSINLQNQKFILKIKNKFIFYLKQLFQYKNIILYYFKKFKNKFNIFFKGKIKKNKNYFFYSFNLKSLKKNIENKLGFFNKVNFMYLFNNIIYKFIFYLNMFWINVCINNININFFKYFNDLKKKKLVLFNIYTTFHEGNKWRRTRKLNFLKFLKFNNFFLYFSNSFINIGNNVNVMDANQFYNNNFFTANIKPGLLHL